MAAAAPDDVRVSVGGGGGERRAADLILAVAGNDRCADCQSTREPVWASSNLGVVFCIACSGVHRSLGAHLSAVLSLYLDDWTEEQVARMRALGNARVNEELEARLPDGVRKPAEAAEPHEREAFIRAKYELRSFTRTGSGRVPLISRASDSTAGMLEAIGVLFVRVISAANLVSMDAVSQSDPYVVLSLGGQSMRTRVVHNDNAPTWEETVSLNVPDARGAAEAHELRLAVWDHDSLGEDKLIGRASVSVRDAVRAPGVPTAVGASLELSAEAARLAQRGGNFAARYLACLLPSKGRHSRGAPSTIALELNFSSLSAPSKR